MDATDFSEGQYITATIVKESPVKIGVILSEAKPEDTRFGKQLTCNVSFNGKIKVWNLNRDSVKNLISVLGSDTSLWVSKKIIFSVMTINSKDRVIGVPTE